MTDDKPSAEERVKRTLAEFNTHTNQVICACEACVQMWAEQFDEAERAAREERDREWIAGISAGIAAIGASVFVCYGKHTPADTAGLIEDLVTVAQMDAASVAEAKGREEAIEECARLVDVEKPSCGCVIYNEKGGYWWADCVCGNHDDLGYASADARSKNQADDLRALKEKP